MAAAQPQSQKEKMYEELRQTLANIRETAKPLTESLSFLQDTAQKLERLEQFVDALARRSCDKFIEVTSVRINAYGELIFEFNNFGSHELAKVKQYDAETTISKIVDQLHSNPMRIANIVLNELSRFVNEVYWAFNVEVYRRIEDVAGKLKALEEKITALETNDNP